MTFMQIPPAIANFLDANTLTYHLSNEPKYGPACTQLVKRVELGDLTGFTSAHALADVAHRLMTLEAMYLNGWPLAGLAARLRKHHSEIPKLSTYRQAIALIPLLGIQVFPITQPAVEAATLLSHQYELLTGDALIVAVMQQHGLTNLASNDPDFDRVPGITRFAPA
jgi:predicted nucleic acid-binding protein